MPSTPELLTPQQVATILDCHVDTVYALKAAGRIGYRTIGVGVTKPRIRFTQADIDAYLRSTHRGAVPARTR